LALALTGATAFAQTDAAPGAAAPAAPPSQPAAEGPSTPGSPPPALDLAGETLPEAAGEIVPLITFDDTPLTDVIKTLARQAGINFLFDPRVTAEVGPDGKPVVQPNISIRFENVTAMQALEAVLANHNLQLVQDPRTKIARVTIVEPGAPEPKVTEIIQLKYSNPTNMVAIITPTLTTPGSRALADVRTSQIVVVATERELESVRTLVERLDTATKQVLIEARLLETSKNPRSIKGIDWTGTFQAQKVTFGNGLTEGFSTVTQPGATTTATTPSGRQVSSTAGSSVASQYTTVLDATRNTLGALSLNTAGGFSPATAFLNADGLSAVLSLLNRDADTEVIATPRTVTLDNQTAILSVTRANPVFKNTAGTQGSPGGSEVTYTNLGTILTVTPRITAENVVSLKVVPEVSRVVDTVRRTVASTVNEADVYAINKIETQVLVPSGNTLVMGGLISDAKTTTRSKVPLLGDLPGLGLAFRHEEKRRDKANLIIFITPTVIQDSDFIPTETAFLKNRPPGEEVEKDQQESWWDSAKPYRWNWHVESNGK
jgi:type II secretory pathway component GspD/PulD (secretin)